MSKSSKIILLCYALCYIFACQQESKIDVSEFILADDLQIGLQEKQKRSAL